MREHVNAWLAASAIGLGMLLLTGWLDRPEQEETCVAEIKDGGGHIHYISGTVADISKD
jgi:hypothetical protein